MRRYLIAAAMLLCLVSAIGAQGHRPKHQVVFEATVVRVEPSGLMKISCGVAIVYRMAEYRVETAYGGDLRSGENVFVQHLACNGNELDDLNVGDKVMVVAERLAKPEKHQWHAYKAVGQTEANCPDKSAEKCFEVPVTEAGDVVTISYRAIKVAKLVYPTTVAAAR